MQTEPDDYHGYLKLRKKRGRQTCKFLLGSFYGTQWWDEGTHISVELQTHRHMRELKIKSLRIAEYALSISAGLPEAGYMCQVARDILLRRRRTSGQSAREPRYADKVDNGKLDGNS